MERDWSFIDLTHTIRTDMPVFPGDRKPRVTPETNWEREGYRETWIEMGSHAGTHTDSPYHVSPEGMKLEEMELSQFAGTALVIDCRDAVLGVPGDLQAEIPMSCIERVREKADQADFVLFLTGWGKYWGTEEYFGRYPVPGMEVCRYLRDSGKKGVGLDTASADPVEDVGLPRHKCLLTGEEKKGFVILENLKNLELLGDDLFFLTAFPLKTEKADGAPVRAVAIKLHSPFV